MLALFGMSVMVVGCTTVPLFNIITPGVGGGIITHHAAASQPQGPRVTFVNDSKVPLSVRYWVGRRDSTAPRGVADIRTDEGFAFTTAPGEFAITQVGRPWWPTSNADAVVRARIAPADESREPVWLDVQQPGPYLFNATGDTFDSIAFGRFGGGGALAPLPRDEWIASNRGPFPVRADLAVR
jgi:hypothetical protein